MLTRRSMRWLGAGLLLAALVALGLWFRGGPVPATQSISLPLTLPDGSVVSVMTTTYGTRHRIGPWLARAVDALPVFLRRLTWRIGGNATALRFSTDTAQPALVVWVLRSLPQATDPAARNHFRCRLADARGLLSGETVDYVGYPLECVAFTNVPAGGNAVTLHFYERGTNGAGQEVGALSFIASFPQRRGVEFKELLPRGK